MYFRARTQGEAGSEHHGLVAVDEHSVFDVPGDGAGKYDLLQIAPLADQVFHLVAVGNPDHILLDDGAVVEHFGNVMTGGADDLHSTLKGLMVGAGANKRRQKRVVNVDDAMGIALHKLDGKNLHVAGQNHEVGLVLVHQGLDSGLGLVLVFLRDRNECVKKFVEVSYRLMVGMIGNNQRNVARQLAALLAVEQIHQAVAELRNKNNHPRAVGR